MTLQQEQEEENASQLQQDRLDNTLANPPKPKKPKPKVKFPWIMFIVALINDLPDIILLFVSLTGIGLAITETLGNILDWTTGPILWIWSKFFSKAKSDPLTMLILATVIESVPFGDVLPSWTTVILIHYFKEKSLSKTGIAGQIGANVGAKKLKK